jgi:hypothetical protein
MLTITKKLGEWILIKEDFTKTKKKSEVWAHREELPYNENELKSINLVYIVLNGLHTLYPRPQVPSWNVH